MKDPNPLILEAKALRDRLTLSGEHPEILKKLNHIVDLADVNSGQAEKLKRLIAAAK